MFGGGFCAATVKVTEEASAAICDCGCCVMIGGQRLGNSAQQPVRIAADAATAAGVGIVEAIPLEALSSCVRHTARHAVPVARYRMDRILGVIMRCS